MKEIWEKLCETHYKCDKTNVIKPQKPIMVFSVIGDSCSFVPIPWQTRVFRRALIEAAKSGGGNVLFLWQINVYNIDFGHVFFMTVITNILLCINNNLINMRKYHLLYNMFCHNTCTFKTWRQYDVIKIFDQICKYLWAIYLHHSAF